MEPDLEGDWVRFSDLAVSETPSDDHQSSLASVDEAQPVAWMIGDEVDVRLFKNLDSAEKVAKLGGHEVTPLYAHPAPQQCYQVRDGYSVSPYKRSDYGYYNVGVTLSDALTLRSVEDVRREGDLKGMEDAAHLIECDGDAMNGKAGAAKAIRALAEKEQTDE